MTSSPPEEIRLLTLWQPWASLVAVGVKKMETRSWGTDYRGLVAIHAASRPFRDAELRAIRQEIKGADSDKLARFAAMFGKRLPCGAIVAVVKVADCSVMAQNRFGPYCWLRDGIKYAPDVLEQAVGNWEAGRYAWDLQDVRPIVPLPVRGRQGFPLIRDADLLASLEQRLAETAHIEKLLEAKR